MALDGAGSSASGFEYDPATEVTGTSGATGRQVTLSAANPNIVSKQHIGYPAAVNHVIYIGDGVTDQTVVRGFEITGANGFDTTLREMEIEPNRELVRQFIYYADGGGIKVFGNSYPRIENVQKRYSFDLSGVLIGERQ